MRIINILVFFLFFNFCNAAVLKQYEEPIKKITTYFSYQKGGTNYFVLYINNRKTEITFSQFSLASQTTLWIKKSNYYVLIDTAKKNLVDEDLSTSMILNTGDYDKDSTIHNAWVNNKNGWQLISPLGDKIFSYWDLEHIGGSSWVVGKFDYSKKQFCNTNGKPNNETFENYFEVDPKLHLYAIQNKSKWVIYDYENDKKGSIEFDSIIVSSPFSFILIENRWSITTINSTNFVLTQINPGKLLVPKSSFYFYVGQNHKWNKYDCYTPLISLGEPCDSILCNQEGSVYGKMDNTWYLLYEDSIKINLFMSDNQMRFITSGLGNKKYSLGYDRDLIAKKLEKLFSNGYLPNAVSSFTLNSKVSEF